MCAGESPARAQVPCWGVWLWRPSPRRRPWPHLTRAARASCRAPSARRRAPPSAYLAGHPGADQAVTTAFSQPRPQAADTLRGYFTANPGEYQDLRGILAPIGDKQRQCNVAVLPPELASAYDQFMAG